jgi:hypothetical protein
MKSKLKKHILQMLSENLEMFHPEHKNSFMCPTCLSVIPTANPAKISEAHIVPKSAGGKLKTFICKKCNSKFGAKQDKWFGEIIKIANDKKKSLFATAIRDGYFLIDGVKVNGHWEQKEDGNLSFFIYVDRNSPDVNRMITDKFGKHPPKIQLSIPLPLLRNQNLIQVGYLTAAYLMWFGLLGYSWALQSHLHQIREQIMHPENEIIDSRYLFSVDSVNWDPWIGLVALFGDTVPAFGLKKHMLVLPPRGIPNYYDSLKRAKTDIQMSDIKALKLLAKPFYGPPVIILFENQVIVCTEPSKNAIEHVQTILFGANRKQGEILRPTDKDTFAELKKLENAKCYDIRLP